MARYLHHYSSQSEFKDEYNGEQYKEPWISYTGDSGKTVSFDKKSEKLTNLLMYIDDFTNDYQSEGFDTEEEFVEWYLDNGYPGVNVYRFSGKSIEFDGDVYYLWKNEDDEYSNMVYYGLTTTIDFEDLYNLSVVANSNNRVCPFYAILHRDFSVSYDLKYKDVYHCIIDIEEDESE